MTAFPTCRVMLLIELERLLASKVHVVYVSTSGRNLCFLFLVLCFLYFIILPCFWKRFTSYQSGNLSTHCFKILSGSCVVHRFSAAEAISSEKTSFHGCYDHWVGRSQPRQNQRIPIFHLPGSTNVIFSHICFIIICIQVFYLLVWTLQVWFPSGEF